MRHVGRLLDADRAVQPALVRPWRRLDGQVAEVLPVVPFDVERRQELGIEVPRREAEGVAVIVTDDGDDVGGPELGNGPGHTFGAVVVGRDRQRPCTERPVHLGEEACRRARREDRVAALVDQVVDVQEAPAGGGHELPDAGRAHLRVGVQVEARLDQRQPGQLDRQPLLAEDALHLGQVAPRDAEAIAEALAQPALAAQPFLVGRREEAVGRRVVGEQVVDRALLRREAFGVRAERVQPE